VDLQLGEEEGEGRKPANRNGSSRCWKVREKKVRGHAKEGIRGEMGGRGHQEEKKGNANAVGCWGSFAERDGSGRDRHAHGSKEHRVVGG